MPAGTYSIDDFGTKIKELVLKQRQDWGPPQIMDLKLVIPRDYAFRADNTIFIPLLIQDKISWVRSALPPRIMQNRLRSSSKKFVAAL